MEIKVIAILVTILILIFWNVLNEVTIVRFWNTRKIEYIKVWHKLDAILRIYLVPFIIISLIGFSYISFKLILTVGILYRPIFNTLFNYFSRKETFYNTNSSVTKLYILLYLSENSYIDSIIINFSNYLAERKVFKYLSKYKYLSINYYKVNLLIIIIEITTSILLWT